MSESAMYKYLREHTQGCLHWERLTDRSRTGVADTVWTARALAITGWCELKYSPFYDFGGPASKRLIPDLRQDQILFLSTQRRVNARASVLLRIRHPDVWILFDVSPDPLQALKDFSVKEPQHTFRWEGLPTPQALAKALIYPDSSISFKGQGMSAKVVEAEFSGSITHG